MNSDFPTAAVGSSQAPTATVEKSSGASNTKIQTAPMTTADRCMPALASVALHSHLQSSAPRA
jgi:hypothetical protein